MYYASATHRFASIKIQLVVTLYIASTYKCNVTCTSLLCNIISHAKIPDSVKKEQPSKVGLYLEMNA